MKRSQLLSILTKIKSGIAAKDIVESMTYFFFSGSDVITYNDQISIQHPLKTDFSLFVKANDLFKIVSKSTADEIELSEKGDKLNVKAKKLNANLATIQDDEVSVRIANVSKSLQNAKWMKLPGNFAECASLCAFSASKSESDQTLTCVRVEGKNCISTDNMRISHATMDSEMKPMFLKASEIKKLLATNPVEYSGSKAWIHFRNDDGCVFSIRKVKGKFPDCLPFFEFTGDKIDLPKELIEGMDIASVFLDDDSPSVAVNISKGKCRVAVVSEAGDIEHSSKIEYEGNDVTFSINPDFLKEMMVHSSSIVLSDDKVKLETENFALVTVLYG